MRESRGVSLTIAIAWAVVVEAPIALAAPPVEQEAARYIVRAQREYDVGKYDAAVASYQRAYGLNRNPELLLIIAHVYDRALRRYALARTYYRLYLASAPSAADEVREELRAAETRSRSAWLRFETKPTDGFVLLIDDERRGTTPVTDPIELRPGRHRLSLLQDGRAAFRGTYDLPTGEHRIAIDLSSPPPAPAEAGRDWRWGLTGAAGGATLAWGSLGVVALATDDGDVALAADVLLGVASGLVVAAIVGWVTQ